MRRPIIVLTMDDGLLTNYTIAYDEIRRRGYKGVSYIITRTPERGLADYMSWAHIRALHSKGWEIACHTHTHQDLSTLTEAQIHEEFQNANQVFQRENIPIPLHHAYPLGGTNETVKNIALQYRETARKTGYLPHHWNTYEQIASREFIGISADIQNESYWLNVKQAIDNAYNNNGVVIPYFHRVGNGDYAITLDYLITLLDYIEGKGMRVMTLTEMYSYVNQELQQ